MVISKPRKKILVLGERGMLGHTVLEYFIKQNTYIILTIEGRWSDNVFKQNLISADVDFIINCIGVIPQNNPLPSTYTKVNIHLPIFLETLGVPIIHPSTDCEFKGDISVGEGYTKSSLRNADDEYGISKAAISSRIEKEYKNTKIIRTSILGHEKTTNLSLLDWFLSQKGSVRGYTNHYWNGITTLEWTKQCQKIIEAWDSFPTLNQLGTKTHYSKYDILSIVREVYKKDTTIIPFTTEITVNKCLLSDIELPELKDQLTELQGFYRK